LDTEYTDQMLHDDVVALLPAYPADWSIGAASAYYTLSTDHTAGAGGKMRYRFHVTDCVKDQQYLVTWDEVTFYPDNPTPAVSHLSEQVAGDATGSVYTSEHEIGVPPSPMTISIANWDVTAVSPSGPPGGGGPGGGGGRPGGGGGGTGSSSGD
jgi:hypothetical protein